MIISITSAMSVFLLFVFLIPSVVTSSCSYKRFICIPYSLLPKQDQTQSDEILEDGEKIWLG